MNTSNKSSQVNSLSEIYMTPAKKLYSVIKRIFDFLFSAFLIILLFIPTLFIALAIKLTSKGPVIFKQKRVGMYKKTFNCYKFRTMRTDAPKSCATAELVNADKYITGVGKFLRKTSLDEIPQLVNIFLGDMSFIGPRPLIPEEEYIHNERQRLGIYLIRPGLSGLAQISGRDSISADEKIRYDYLYLKRYGMITDLSILIKTVLKVLGENDIVEGATEKAEKAEE